MLSVVSEHLSLLVVFQMVDVEFYSHQERYHKYLLNTIVCFIDIVLLVDMLYVNSVGL
jgi:hypothetical protein